jgi:Ca2+-binding RTX toxin-like protein/subtilisin-like proprotein convertase family protein
MSSHIPEDPLMPFQWHLFRLGDLQRIWAEFTGLGISVGVYDDGIQYTHPDLDDNYDPSKHVVIGSTTFDGANVGNNGHGTSVAGLIAAENNGEGTVGIAFDASLTSVNIFDNTSALFINRGTPTGFYAAIAQSSRFDVVNNSWGSTPQFAPLQNVDIAGSFAAQTVAGWASAAATGRGGLGTIIVKSSGNESRDLNGEGGNVTRYNISVAAIGDSGFAASYSNHGASTLIAAPGDEFAPGLGIVTTDLLGTEGSNLRADSLGSFDYTDDFGGTSAAAPIVTAVTALMLDANAGLGWRDVQNILAASATHTGSAFGATTPGTNENGTWFFNDADTWNGGGMHAHTNYGYGALNAYNAVRMAEVWTLFSPAQTSANEQSSAISVNMGGDFNLFEDPAGIPTVTWGFSPNILIEHVSITLTLTHQSFTDLRLFLTSAEGTRVQIQDGTSGSGTSADAPLTWTYGIDLLRGENANGTWKLEVQDVVIGDVGVLANNFTLRVYGTALTANDVFHFTDEFAAIAALQGENGRRTLTDTDGGIDWINAAAVTTSSIINLNADTYSSIGGSFVRIAAGSVIENAIGGDGGDLLIGNALANELRGMRGADVMRGGGGDDLYVVDNAADLVTEAALAGEDTVNTSVSYALAAGSSVERLQTTDAAGTAALSLTGNDLDQVIIGNEGANLLLGLGGRDELLGGGGADTLEGGAGIDTLRGQGGDDLLRGGLGGVATLDDQLFGDDGNDTLIGGAGGDNLVGGGDRDMASYEGALAVQVSLDNSLVFTGDAAEDTLFGIEDLGGSSADDTLAGNQLANLLRGESGSDLLFGRSGNDTLFGSLGNDTLDGGTGTDLMNGGGGDDRYIVDAEFDTAGEFPSGGYDTVDAFVSYRLASEVEVLNLLGSAQNGTGNAQDNLIIGNAGDNSLDGEAGSDTLAGGLGADSMAGGAGSDLYFVDTTTDVVTEDLGGGSDTLRASASYTLATGSEVERLETTDQNAATTINLTGNAFGQTIAGNAGANRLSGLGGNDALSGNGGNDQLLGGEGNDNLNGGFGNDTLIGGLGADVMNGGNGSDLADYSAAALAVAINLATGGTVGEAAGDSFISIERVVGSGHNDTLAGSGTADRLEGIGGNDLLIGDIGGDTLAGGDGNDRLDGGADGDSLVGGDGADSFSGGDGNDSMTGGLGADTLNGGAGYDWVDYAAASLAVALNLATGGTAGEASGDVFSGIERVIGSNFNDTLTGGTLGDRLDGGRGNDALAGGAGNDALYGNDGNDTLTGGLGRDRLEGGAGSDVFLFGLATDSPAGLGDSIVDFGAGDLIDLSALDADSDAGNGNTSFSYAGAAAFSALAQVRVVTVSVTQWLVEVNLVGSTAADMSITVSGTGTPSAAWFIL